MLFVCRWRTKRIGECEEERGEQLYERTPLKSASFTSDTGNPCVWKRLSNKREREKSDVWKSLTFRKYFKSVIQKKKKKKKCSDLG